MNISDKITEIYTLISASNTKKHLLPELYFLIVQIKLHNEEYKTVHQTIYQDSKQFISLYIRTTEKRDLGYDIINSNKIVECILSNNKYDEQYRLALFAFRILKSNGFEDESKELKRIINETKTKLIRYKPNQTSVVRYLRLALHLSTYNIWTISLVIAVLFLITNIIFLPAPFENWGIYKITYNNYSSIFLFNHFLNLLSFIFGVNPVFKTETSSVLGVLVLVLMKSFYLVFIINYLYELIIDLIRNK